MSPSRRARSARRHSGTRDIDKIDDRRLIIGALRCLSAEQRAVIHRSHYLGWTTTQIANELQVTDNHVKGTLHQALRELDLTLTRIRAHRGNDV